MIFLNGGCRIIGGYQNFANALGNCIKKHGGTICTNDEVTRIRTSGKMVNAIETHKGSIIEGDYFISAIPPIKMLDILDNKHVFSNAYQTFIKESEDSYSAFILNVKLKDKMLPYLNHISFYLEHYDSDWSVSDGTDVEKFMYMTPPTENQDFYARTFNVIALMKWEAVERWVATSVGNRGDDYLNWKQQISNIIIRKLNKAIPGFDGMIAEMEAASPLTIRDYTTVRRGAMCGMKKKCDDMISSFLPIKTKVKNLLLTGQSCNFHGFCGVSLTAIQTCEAILGEHYLINKLSNVR